MLRSNSSNMIIEIDEAIKERHRDVLAYLHQSISNVDSFYFNPMPMLISNLELKFTSSLWKNISDLSGNQSSFLLHYSTIDEITMVRNYAIIRSRNGLCAVYKLIDRSFICYLNQMDHEIVKSIFVNESGKGDSMEIIKAVCLKSDNFSRIRCFKTQLNDLKNCEEIFKELNVSYPGFVEFDSINGRAIVLTRDLKYSVFNLHNLSKETEISGKNIKDVKLVPDLILLTKSKENDYSCESRAAHMIKYGCEILNELEELVNLEFHTFKGSSTAIDFQVVKGVQIQFIDCLGSSVVIKQVGLNARVYNIGTNQITEMENTDTLKINDFIFLYRAKKIIVHRNGDFSVFSFSGEFLFNISSSSPQRNLSASPVAVTPDQKFFTCCCHSSFDQWIYVFSLLDGKLLLNRKIPAKQSNGYKITAICFDDISNTLITGDEGGNIAFYQ